MRPEQGKSIRMKQGNEYTYNGHYIQGDGDAYGNIGKNSGEGM